VGITHTLRARFRQHFAESSWVADVRRLEFDTGYTEAEARREEIRLIRELKPTHNKIFALPDKVERTRPLSGDQRREIVLATLNGENKSFLARRYGISRRWLYDLLEDATSDPEGKYEEAVKELAFRREVRDLLAKRQQQE
jgi:hypothetical protein